MLRMIFACLMLRTQFCSSIYGTATTKYLSMENECGADEIIGEHQRINHGIHNYQYYAMAKI